MFVNRQCVGAGTVFNVPAWIYAGFFRDFPSLSLAAPPVDCLSELPGPG